MNEKHAKLIQELRWAADKDDIEHDICYSCDDAADVIEAAFKLVEAIDNYTKEPNARNWTEVLFARKALK